jgi:hypothetical protein
MWIAGNVVFFRILAFSRFLENSFRKDCKKFGYNI